MASVLGRSAVMFTRQIKKVKDKTKRTKQKKLSKQVSKFQTYNCYNRIMLSKQAYLNEIY